MVPLPPSIDGWNNHTTGLDPTLVASWWLPLDWSMSHDRRVGRTEGGGGGSGGKFRRPQIVGPYVQLRGPQALGYAADTQNKSFGTHTGYTNFFFGTHNKKFLAPADQSLGPDRRPPVHWNLRRAPAGE